jgi:hypothetical protein
LRCRKHIVAGPPETEAGRRIRFRRSSSGEAIVRILLALAVLAGGIVALDTPADAARKRAATKQTYKSAYAAKSRYKDYREQVECERAVNEDPSGEFANYPCWAREVFARGRRGDSSRWD